MKEIVKVSSPDEMFLLGVECAKKFAHPGLILALKGDLGAGKTTFLKGFISEAAGISPHEIQSPTFTYLQTYGIVYHFDLYRLQNTHQFISAGFSDYLQMNGICCLEWAERIESILPPKTLFLEISYLGPYERSCTLERAV